MKLRQIHKERASEVGESMRARSSGFSSCLGLVGQISLSEPAFLTSADSAFFGNQELAWERGMGFPVFHILATLSVVGLIGSADLGLYSQDFGLLMGNVLSLFSIGLF